MSNRYLAPNVISINSTGKKEIEHSANTDAMIESVELDTAHVDIIEKAEYLDLNDIDLNSDESQLNNDSIYSWNTDLDVSQLVKAAPQLIEILKLCHEEAKALLDVEGMLFVNQEHRVREKFGSTQTAYNCGFCLLSDYDDNLGELVLFRKKRFSEQELDQIDLLIHLMTTPLTKAMRRQRLQTG